ncbi:carbohydrate ABC transporter permease [Caldicellulosiruptoraceae bacterium PP1]
MLKRESVGDKVFDIVNVFFMLIVCFLTLYPIWYIIVYSFNEGKDAMLGGLYWWPRKFTIDNYRIVFSNQEIVNAFAVTVSRTLITTFLHVFFTAMVAYAFMKKELIGRKLYLTLGTITLFFGGGLIPYFLLIKSLGLYDNFLVYVIPGMFNFYNLIIFQAFFRELPAELEESARIDGANDFLIFFKIIVPLSTPVLATIALFVGVYNWNDYFMGVIFVNNPKLQPIQTFLYKVIAETSSNQMLASGISSLRARTATSQSLKMATMVITTMPIVVIYPFLQRYFVKGLLIGSVKG